MAQLYTPSTDWTTMPEAQLFQGSGRSKKKKGKKRRWEVNPYEPPESSAAGPVPAPGLGGTPPPPAKSPNIKAAGTGKPTVSTNPAEFNKGVAGATETPFPGSFAGNYPDVWSNPAAANIVAQSPGILANDIMKQQYGLPAGSYSSQLFSTYLNPQDKWMGMLGSIPTSNNDWINFGASLMQGPAGGAAPGTQLSPKGMMANAVSTIRAEFDAMMKGGSGSSDVFNPLTEMAHTDPQSALTSFTSMVEGMLTGTMPDDVITAYVGFLRRIGSQFMQEWVHGNVGEMEASGANFLTALIDRLGPTLGL